MNNDKRAEFIKVLTGRTSLIIIFFALLFVYSKWGPAIPFSTTTQTKGEAFVVMGTGKVSVVPDIAKVTLGIEENGSSLKTVQDNVNKKSKTLTEDLKKIGVEDNNLKTISYNVSPEYDYNSSPYKITGYRVSTSYEVKVTDFDIVNDVLTLATQSGANVVGSISFEVNEETQKEYLQKAREEAVKLAKNKAEGLAKASGITLGKIINVSESEGYEPRPVMMYDKAVGMGGAPETTNIEAGETEIQVTVSLSYEIR